MECGDKLLVWLIECCVNACVQNVENTCTFDCLLKQSAKQLSKQCMEHFIFYRSDSDCVDFHIIVTYVAGPVKSTVDYIMVWQEDKAKIRNVKVITSEECVPKHKLLVMDMRFKATKRRRRKFEPRVRAWKLKEEKTCEEYWCMVRDKVEEAKWKGLCVNDH